MLFRQDPYYGHLLSQNSLSWLELALTSTPRPVLSVQGHDSDMGQMSSLANLGLPPDAKCRVTVTFSSCFQLSHCFPHYSEHSRRKLSLSKARTPGSSEEGETGQLSNWRHATRDGSCDGGNEHFRKASLHPPFTCLWYLKKRDDLGTGQIARKARKSRWFWDKVGGWATAGLCDFWSLSAFWRFRAHLPFEIIARAFVLGWWFHV